MQLQSGSSQKASCAGFAYKQRAAALEMGSISGPRGRFFLSALSDGPWTAAGRSSFSRSMVGLWRQLLATAAGTALVP